MSYIKKERSSREAAASVLRKFLDSRTTAWEWDDFVSDHQKDPALEEIRTTCLRVRHEYPSGAMGAWCSPAGFEEIREKAVKLLSSLGPIEDGDV